MAPTPYCTCALCKECNRRTIYVEYPWPAYATESRPLKEEEDLKIENARLKKQLAAANTEIFRLRAENNRRRR